jgi:hypothetical protein
MNIFFVFFFLINFVMSILCKIHVFFLPDSNLVSQKNAPIILLFSGIVHLCVYIACAKVKKKITHNPSFGHVPEFCGIVGHFFCWLFSLLVVCRSYS